MASNMIRLTLTASLFSFPALAQETISYGPRTDQLIDITYPATPCPCPLLLYFHAGGFTFGNRTNIPPGWVTRFLAAGFVVASPDYSLGRPYPQAFLDGMRSLQYLRTRPEVDKTAVVLAGGSAGAGIAQWIAFRDEMAKPDSPDYVLKESTRVSGVVTMQGQTTYTPLELTAMFGVTQYPGFLRTFWSSTDKQLAIPHRQTFFARASPITYYSADDPPIFASYRPDAPAWLHDAKFGAALLNRRGADVTILVTNDEQEIAAKSVAFALDVTGR